MVIESSKKKNQRDYTNMCAQHKKSALPLYYCLLYILFTNHSSGFSLTLVWNFRLDPNPGFIVVYSYFDSIVVRDIVYTTVLANVQYLPQKNSAEFGIAVSVLESL